MTDPDEFLKLERGWNSYDACTISPLAIKKAKEIIAGLPAGKWYCVPVATGGIQIEQHDTGIDVEISIEPAP